MYLQTEKMYGSLYKMKLIFGGIIKMKRHTLIKNTKPNEHTYLVTIGTDIGQFTGVVECREEDWDYESQYFGFELAEIKAEIEYARIKRKYYDAQLKALTEFWRDMRQTRTYDIDAFWVKKMRDKVSKVAIEREHCVEVIKDLKRAYHLKITTFDSVKKTRKKCEECHND